MMSYSYDRRQAASLEGETRTASMPRSRGLEPGWYRHFKGGRYKVLFTARHSEDETWQAIYLNAKGEPWARPLRMWNEVTDRWPDGVKRPRFIPEAEAEGIFE